MQYGLSELQRLLSQFDAVVEIPLDQPILDASADLMVAYQIASYDAVHIATALNIGVQQIVTADADFQRVTQPG